MSDNIVGKKRKIMELIKNIDQIHNSLDTPELTEIYIKTVEKYMDKIINNQKPTEITKSDIVIIPNNDGYCLDTCSSKKHTIFETPKNPCLWIDTNKSANTTGMKILSITIQRMLKSNGDFVDFVGLIENIDLIDNDKKIRKRNYYPSGIDDINPIIVLDCSNSKGKFIKKFYNTGLVTIKDVK